MDVGRGIQRDVFVVAIPAWAESDQFLCGVRFAFRGRAGRCGGARRPPKTGADHRYYAGRNLRALRRRRNAQPHPWRHRFGRSRAADGQCRQDDGSDVSQALEFCAAGGDRGLHLRCAGAMATPLGVRDPGAGQHRAGLDHDAEEPMNSNPLYALFGYFALLSLFAVGGANAAIPEMHRVAVDVMHWMTDRQFADMFAIAQISPGPNVIVVTLIGYHVAGLTGAAVATVGMCGPTCCMAFFVARVWDRFKDAPWRTAIQAGLVPVSLGLIAASAFVLARAADHTILAALITAGTAIVAYFTRVNPLWVFLVAGLAGLSGML